MDCEICGKNDSLVLVSVQGTQMFVCTKCSHHGVEITQRVANTHTSRSIISSDEKEDFYDLIENYGKVIQQACQKQGLGSKQFASKIAEQESFVKKIQAEKIIPSEQTIKKIEKVLNIKIYKKVEQE